MAKLTLNTLVGGLASLSKLNANFSALVTALQNQVLYRDNPTGEPNQMETELDMNGQSIYNVDIIETTSLKVGDSWITEPGTSVVVQAEADTTYQATALDSGVCKVFDDAGDCTYTVLADADIGTFNFFINVGGGDVVLDFGADTEVNGYTTLVAGKMGCAAKIAAGTWALIGDVS